MNAPPLPDYVSPGQRLFEAAVAEGIPMHPTKWAELHPDWQATWTRIAARAAIDAHVKRLLRAIHLIKNEWGKTEAEVLAWLDDDARWSDPGFADVADDPAAHLVGAIDAPVNKT